MIDQLKEALQQEVQSGRTLTDVSRDSGIGLDRLSRFVRGERDLTGKAIGKVCEALGLELVRRRPLKKKRADKPSDN